MRLAGACKDGTQEMSLAVQTPVVSWLKGDPDEQALVGSVDGVSWAAMLLPSP